MRTATGATAPIREAGAPALFERERELEQLRQAINSAKRGVGGLVVIKGPAGIGKSALLNAAYRSADRAGLRVLRARASDLELEFAFGVVRQLFEGVLAHGGESERAALFQGAAALASPLFDPEPAVVAEVRPAVDLSFTLVHGLYWLTANLAEAGPVMVGLDDAHWADGPSLRFLAYLSARCEGLPVLIAVTLRQGEPTGARGLLTALRNEPVATPITPASLTPGAVAAVVRSRLGEHADDEFCAACAHASAGNPFLLRELIAELEAERVEPVATRAAYVDAVRPNSVSRAVLARLARIGGDARTLARAVAVLETASVRQAAGLAKIDEQRARRAADQLISAQVLVPADLLTFLHPLLRRAVYESVPPAARADGHRRAGLSLAAEGARGTRVVAHLLRGAAAGDPQVVALLRGAARDALAEGAPRTAASLLRRALSEPPPGELRTEVLAELGQAEALARDPAAAGHLSEALDRSDRPAARVPLACALGELLAWNGQPVQAHALLTRTIEELGREADPVRRAALETLRFAIASVDKRLVAQVEPRLAALRELAVMAGPSGRALLIFDACWRAQREPHSGDWRQLLDRGLDGGRFVAEQTASSPMVSYATIVLALADEGPRAQAMLNDIRADARIRGSIHAHLTAMTWGALLALRRGELRHAESDARAALDLARGHELLWTASWTAAFLGQSLLEQGALEQAERALEQASIDEIRGTSAALHALLARGRLRLAQGRRAEGIDDLRAAGAGMIADNPSYVPWRSTLALALAPDDPVQARSLAQAELDRARELGQPRGIGVALRAQGLLEPGARSMATLHEAVHTLRSSPARLELARTLCDLGAAMRRHRQRSAAREPLREGLELAQRCGAEALAELARVELLATGAKARRAPLGGPEALTPSERRVAELAAAGLANREIAQALFITTKTVGTHLGHIYQKLDIQGQGRERIAERLGKEDESADATAHG